MADSPGRDLSVVTAFARSLAGTLRPQSVADLLVAQVKATFGPVASAVALLHPETLQLETVSGDRSLGENRRLIEAALSRTEPVSDANGTSTLIAVRLHTRRPGLGVLLARLEHPSSPNLALLEALAAAAGVALDSARVVELADNSKRAWEETLDAVSLALCIIEPGGRVQRANRALAELLEIPISTLVSRPWHELMPQDWHPGIRQALGEAGTATSATLRHRDRIYGATVFPISGGESGRVVLLLSDQTERQRLQDQLVQSEKLSAIGQLIAGIAHDLNNPLTSVVGFADYLAEFSEVPPRIREPLLVIQQEAERAALIVKNLLGFARKQEHRRRPTSMRSLLEATLTLLRNQLMAVGVEAELSCDPDVPELDLDQVQIQQVFVNLINNAAQAIASTGRPGTIRIQARRWLGGVSVTVADDGPGMDESLAARAFEPFFTTKPEGDGTGLGLSISQGIVKEHQGMISLSTRPGEGATFTVELPARPTPPRPPAEEAPPVAIRPLRVLVVDDEPHILHYVRATLEAWGHKVDVAADGQAALAQVGEAAYDLIISDLRMPRTGGQEFYEELGRRFPSMADRVAFSTGDTIRGDTLQFLEKQHRPWLRKPFSLSELRGLLREFSQLPPVTRRRALDH
jgi:two-component system NtrC family sensor kinase